MGNEGNRMRRRSVALHAIVAAAAVCVLSSCQGATPGMSNGSGDQTPPAGAGTALTMFARQAPDIETLDSPDNEYTVFMEQKFGVEIEWIAVPVQQRHERQSLLLASDDYPEVFWDGQFNNADQMLYGGQEVLISLNSLIAQAPDILAAFVLKPYFRPAITTPDGNIYTLPLFQECYHCSLSQKVWINQHWLDALDLSMPATTEEFEATLRAFKQSDPNGNGAPDEIPLTGAANSWRTDVYDFLLAAFIYNDGDSYLFIDDQGRAGLVANKPEWQDGLRYVKRLYDQGLIDPRSLTQDRDAAKDVTDVYPAVVGAYAAGHARMLAHREGLWQQYVAVAPLRGPQGVRWSAHYPSGVGDGKFAITDRADDVQKRKAMEMANWAYTREGTLYELFGVPTNRDGVVNWRWARAGERGLDGEPAIYWVGLGPERASRRDTWRSELVFWHAELFNGWAQEQDVTQVGGYERLLFRESDKYIPYVPERDELVPNRLYHADETAQRVAQIRAEIQDYVHRNAVAFITGQSDLDSEWESYVGGFATIGLDEYLATIQEAMDAAAQS